MFCTYGKDTMRQKSFKQAPILTESIYNLIPRPEVQVEKPKRYKSKHNEEVKGFYQSVKSPHKTMGYFKTPLAPPNDFLRKHSKEPKLGEKKPFNFPDDDRRKPAVPKHDERPVMPGPPSKNFIKENMRDVIRAAPRKPHHKVVDTQHGDIVLLEFSGLVPKYSVKEEFGQTPKYLVRRKADMEFSQKAYEEFVKEQCMKRAPKKVTIEEREELLDGLKRNWAQKQHEYLGLSLITDTLRKKMRKERIEDELKSLEQDIKLMERHEEIYIFNPDQ